LEPRTLTQTSPQLLLSSPYADVYSDGHETIALSERVPTSISVWFGSPSSATDFILIAFIHVLPAIFALLAFTQNLAAVILYMYI
jgi:hypothetical protein